MLPLALHSSALVHQHQGSQDLAKDATPIEAEEDLLDCNWADIFPVDKLHQEQENDPDLGPIITWLNWDYSPPQEELSLQSPATKHLWLCRAQLRFRKRVLYYKW